MTLEGKMLETLCICCAVAVGSASASNQVRMNTKLMKTFL